MGILQRIKQAKVRREEQQAAELGQPTEDQMGHARGWLKDAIDRAMATGRFKTREDAENFLAQAVKREPEVNKS